MLHLLLILLLLLLIGEALVGVFLSSLVVIVHHQIGVCALSYVLLAVMDRLISCATIQTLECRACHTVLQLLKSSHWVARLGLLEQIRVVLLLLLEKLHHVEILVK